jgi:hypothetical protein
MLALPGIAAPWLDRSAVLQLFGVCIRVLELKKN